MWKRGEIAPGEQFLPFSTIFQYIFLLKGVRLLFQHSSTARGYKNLMLNSAEHEILPADKQQIVISTVVFLLSLAECEFSVLMNM